MSEENTITINGVEYIRKDPLPVNPTGRTLAPLKEGLEYKMVRADRAGVFAGYVESIDAKSAVVILRNARRIWYWDGAASLSQLATDGTSKPQNCKFPCEVDRVELFGVIEIIDITEKAQKSIAGVPVWKK